MSTQNVNTKYGNTKNAHVIAQTYLDAWAVDGNIGVHIVQTGKQLEQPVKKVGTRRYFYRRERPNTGELIDDVEHTLGLAEAMITPTLRELDERWPFGLEDKRKLAEFLAYQLLRGPRFKDSFETSGREFVAEKRERGTYEVAGTEVDIPDNVLTHLEEAFADSPAGNTTRLMRMIAMAPTITSVLGSMSWALIDCGAPIVATCDHPMTLYPRQFVALKPAPIDVRHVGLLETIEIRVPLTPTCVLLMTWDDTLGADGLRVPGDRVMAMNINAFTIAHADEHWFWRAGAKAPPRGAGLLRPISVGLVPGYDHARCERSILRRDVGAYANSKRGRDLRDCEVQIFSVADPTKQRG